MEEIQEVKEVLDSQTEEETKQTETEESQAQTEAETQEVEESEENTDEDTKETKQEDKPKKQTADERKRFAEMRRAKEAKEREEAIKKAKQEGIIEGLGGINPYTSEKIEDDIDYELYQEMKDAESKGYNPNDLSDMRKYRKEVRQAELVEQRKKSESQSNAQKDIDDFIKNNPDVNIKTLLSDKDFLEFADGMLGNVSLGVVYGKYQNYKNMATAKAEALATEEKARRISSVGSLGNGEDNKGTYSLEDITKMSREEIEKNYDKVVNSYFDKK
ncbi:MAG TPA: hypothetical protein PKV66_01665 [Candidatus Pelethenecus sp.]|nr:hypothetical protein [Candidatus Pelethenecus sp.]